jgi:hypothetical protein
LVVLEITKRNSQDKHWISSDQPIINHSSFSALLGATAHVGGEGTTEEVVHQRAFAAALHSNHRDHQQGPASHLRKFRESSERILEDSDSFSLHDPAYKILKSRKLATLIARTSDLCWGLKHLEIGKIQTPPGHIHSEITIQLPQDVTNEVRTEEGRSTELRMPPDSLRHSLRSL